jgi:adenosylmethionine---8-amino-7-oxononanoate aminotransferase
MSLSLGQLDQQHVWHPFTPMQPWCDPAHEPLVITHAEGCWLYDEKGQRYFDGNSSIWTNLHGHRHPRLDAALRAQLEKFAHVSFLGTTHEPAIRLAQALVELFPPQTLTRVFFTDNGSTAIECAMKMAVQWAQLSGQSHRTRFIAFDHAYHGDTFGAASLGGIETFFGRFKKLGLPVEHVADLATLQAWPAEASNDVIAVVIEPLIQGAAGMRLWPAGMLRALRQWCDERGIFLILDEVMTGFGRTGKMFACQHEDVIPDFLCLAKGLSAGYSPLAATLTTERVFSTFLGRVDEMKTFYYGHSYSGHALGCAVALENVRLFHDEEVLAQLPEKIGHFHQELARLVAAHPQHLSPARQCGLIAGIDVWADAEAGRAYLWTELTGGKICQAARRHGLLTRPIRDTLVLMPPLCATKEEITHAVNALSAAIAEVTR